MYIYIYIYPSQACCESGDGGPDADDDARNDANVTTTSDILARVPLLLLMICKMVIRLINGCMNHMFSNINAINHNTNTNNNDHNNSNSSNTTNNNNNA